ncbi:MAG TPA: ATP-binding protein [Candidatus Binataceae bacterium]|nr:ATP-binding protein [Candidatus Binataceae bacterium]
MNPQSGLQEPFAQFFEDPSRETLRNLLKEYFGETGSLDFKEQWPTRARLAKHVLGMANTSNGCLVIGVGEKTDKTLEPIGLKDFKDKADIQNGLKRFLPSDLM